MSFMSISLEREEEEMDSRRTLCVTEGKGREGRNGQRPFFLATKKKTFDDQRTEEGFNKREVHEEQQEQ